MRHAVLLGAMLLAGRAATAQRLARPIIDTLPHGIVRVRNTGPAMWSGLSGWQFVLEQTIAADGTAGLIAEPRTVAVDSHGKIFETDWKVDAIQEWDRTGKFVRTLGRKGDGPGEFKVPINIAIRGDTLLAYASNQRRVSLWRTDGTLIREWRVDFCCGGEPRFGLQGTVMVRVAIHISNDVYRRGVIRWRPDGSIVDTMLLPIEAPVHTWDVSHATWTIPFTAYQVGVLDSHAWYVGGFGGRYSLVMAPHGTDTARIVEMPGTRVKLAAAVADSVFAGYEKIPQLAGVAKRGDIPTELPYFDRLHVDEHDNIWIERPAPDGQAASFDVIDHNGTFLGSVPMPPGHPTALHFVNGRLYASAATADGDVVLQVYRIDRRNK
jgi:hypothetical protein